MFINITRTEKEISDLIFTLEICRKELPSDAHPAHYERLYRLIKDLNYYNKEV